MSAPDLDAHAAIFRRGRCALAWEVLRRDPDYRAAWSRTPAAQPGAAAEVGFVERWGLHFR